MIFLEIKALGLLKAAKRYLAFIVALTFHDLTVTRVKSTQFFSAGTSFVNQKMLNVTYKGLAAQLNSPKTLFSRYYKILLKPLTTHDLTAM